MTMPTEATPNHCSNGKNHQNIHNGRVVSMPSTGVGPTIGGMSTQHSIRGSWGPRPLGDP